MAKYDRLEQLLAMVREGDARLAGRPSLGERLASDADLRSLYTAFIERVSHMQYVNWSDPREAANAVCGDPVARQLAVDIYARLYGDLLEEVVQHEHAKHGRTTVPALLGS